MRLVCRSQVFLLIEIHRVGCEIVHLNGRKNSLLVASCNVLPKLVVADNGVGGGKSTPSSKCARLMAATSRRSRAISCSIRPSSHSTSTRISNSESLRELGRDSMWSTFTPRSCVNGQSWCKCYIRSDFISKSWLRDLDSNGKVKTSWTLLSKDEAN